MSFAGGQRARTSVEAVVGLEVWWIAEGAMRADCADVDLVVIARFVQNQFGFEREGLDLGRVYQLLGVTIEWRVTMFWVSQCLFLAMISWHPCGILCQIC